MRNLPGILSHGHNRHGIRSCQRFLKTRVCSSFLPLATLSFSPPCNVQSRMAPDIDKGTATLTPATALLP
jgi:hypothetical protein